MTTETVATLLKQFNRYTATGLDAAAERVRERIALIRAKVDADGRFPVITEENFAEALAYQDARIAYHRRQPLGLHYESHGSYSITEVYNVTKRESVYRVIGEHISADYHALPAARDAVARLVAQDNGPRWSPF